MKTDVIVEPKNICKNESFFRYQYFVFERPICLPAENQILQLAYKEQVKVAVSALSVVNTIYVAKKYGKSNNDVKASLSSLTKHIDIIDLKGKNVVDMLEDDWNDYEDGLQFVSAENYKSDFIITRNKKDFSQSSIIVLSPQEFIDMVEDD